MFIFGSDGKMMKYLQIFIDFVFLLGHFKRGYLLPGRWISRKEPGNRIFRSSRCGLKKIWSKNIIFSQSYDLLERYFFLRTAFSVNLKNHFIASREDSTVASCSLRDSPESSSFHPEIHVRKVQNHTRNENIPSGLGFVEILKGIHRIAAENGGVTYVRCICDFRVIFGSILRAP